MASVKGTLEHALSRHKAGALSEARRLYGRILASDPSNPEALHLFGVALLQSGRHEEAAVSLRKAIDRDPHRAEFHLDLGEVFAAQDRLSEAQKCFEEALRLRPNYAEAYNNLGLVFQAHSKHTPALRCFLRAIMLRPDFAEPFNHAGLVAYEMKQFDDAIDFFAKSSRLDAKYAAPVNNLGLVYLLQGANARAAHYFNEALRIDPRFAPAHNNLGIYHHTQGQMEEAARSFRSAIQCDPKPADPYNNLANVHRIAERRDEAFYYYQQALQRSPNHPEARANLCLMLAEEGRYSEAALDVERALAQAPNDALKLLSVLLLPVIPGSSEEADKHRRRIENGLAFLRNERLSIEDPLSRVGNLSFYLAYQGKNDRAIMSDLAAIYLRSTPSLAWIAPHCRDDAPKRREGRIRVGFISRLFFNHTIGKLNAGLIRHLSREHFEISALTFHRPDDEWRNEIRRSADRFILLPNHLEQARRTIAEQEFDILFYTDIGMDPWTYYLAFSRLAPIQCVTWGHPDTTGIPTMDYFISARDLDPSDGESHYTEKLVRLDNMTTYYYRPHLPEKWHTRSHFGLSENDHLYACPQSLFKFHPEFDILLQRILQADPKGRLVLVAGQKDYWCQLLKKRFEKTLGTAADRVVFLPRLDSSEFLSILAISEVVLDTIHFGGGNTSLETFAVGAPLVTLPGNFLRSRLTYGLYRRMGILDLVASDGDDYVNLAVSLGTNPDRRAEMSRRILENKDVLFENPGILRDLEQFFLAASNQLPTPQPRAALAGVETN
jgi:protein O-GlcNAc transferase